tara:strand:+ start:921 stop:1373 length:453 start_codon:yes stop_codon:yes gene_type:complete
MLKDDIKKINFVDDEFDFYANSSGYFCNNFRLKSNQRNCDKRTDCYNLNNNYLTGKIIIGPVKKNDIIIESQMPFFKKILYHPGKYIFRIGYIIFLDSFEIESKKMLSGEIWIRIRKIVNNKINGPFCINYKIICCQPISITDRIQLNIS